MRNLNETSFTTKLRRIELLSTLLILVKFCFCAIVLYLVVYHVCFQDGKLCLLVANDKLDGK
jgi:hypothetical protein